MTPTGKMMAPMKSSAQDAALMQVTTWVTQAAMART
ncbi:hypothetical protein ABIF91_001690 [Bradyrhizobium sp. USDA 241]